MMKPDPRYIDCPIEYPLDTVVLVSGGVDSLINADNNPEATLLFVDFHSDAENELRTCRTLFSNRSLRIVTVTTKWPSADGFFVPARNLMLATMAVPYGSNIIIGAMKDDHSIDKTPLAISQMSAILSLQSGRPVVVTAPLNNTYKFDAVRQYATTPMRIERMKRTWSCYTTKSERCYDCKACFRWSVALNMAGIEVPKPSERISEFFLERLELFDRPEQEAIVMVCT
jgi:7-cyano-7-deazaguanine synthase in queuosine biosynthesis